VAAMLRSTPAMADRGWRCWVGAMRRPRESTRRDELLPIESECLLDDPANWVSTAGSRAGCWLDDSTVDWGDG